MSTRSVPAVAPTDFAVPKKYILVTCRDLEAAEKAVLSQNFQQIIPYHAPLSSGKTDLAEMAFDLIIVAAREQSNHLFLEIVAPQAKALEIPVIVLKQSLTNSKALAKEMDAFVISSVSSLSGENFIRFLTKQKLPKLASRLATCFWRLLSVLLK